MSDSSDPRSYLSAWLAKGGLRLQAKMQALVWIPMPYNEWVTNLNSGKCALFMSKS